MTQWVCRIPESRYLDAPGMMGVWGSWTLAGRQKRQGQGLYHPFLQTRKTRGSVITEPEMVTLDSGSSDVARAGKNDFKKSKYSPMRL